MNLTFRHSKTLTVCISAAVLSVAGCTQSARSDYGAAGSNAATAAKDAEKGIVADATAAGHTITGAVDNTSKVNNQTSAKVKQAILDAPDIETTDLTVDTNGRTVTLHGSVLTEVQNQRAEQLARSVLGSAYYVNDQLAVSSQI
jgi:osmotically-inducible protein OsmY